jgi:ATP-dependent RNA helicase DDX3X
MADSWGAPPSAEATGNAIWGAGGGDNGTAGGDAWGSAPADTMENTTPAAPTADEEAKKKERDEQRQRARAAGWTETTAFDYDEFMRTGGEAPSFSTRILIDS